MLKIIATLFFLSLSFNAYSDVSIPAASQNNPENKEINDYTHKLVSKALDILNSPTKEAKEAKIIKARALILANLDFDSMARRSLGNYRKDLSSEQMQQFIGLYKNYVSKSYTNLIKDYKGGEKDVTITSTTHLANDDFKVSMTIINNDQPINIDYYVRHIGPNSFKVFDVITEGSSLVDSQASDFGGMISNKGFDSLLEFLKSKS